MITRLIFCGLVLCFVGRTLVAQEVPGTRLPLVPSKWSPHLQNQGIYQLHVKSPHPNHKVLRTLGLTLRQISDPVVYEHIDIQSQTGLVVDNVLANLAADVEGIEANDIITKVDKQTVASVDDFVTAYESAKETNVSIELFQKGRSRVVVVNRDDAIEQARDYRIGVYIDEVPQALVDHLELEGGVFITKVIDDTPAETAGIMAHDIIVRIGGEDVASSAFLSEMVDQSSGNELKLDLIRAGKPISLNVTPEEAPDTDPAEYLIQFDQSPANLASLAWVQAAPNSQPVHHMPILVERIEQLSKQIEKLQKQLDSHGK